MEINLWWCYLSVQWSATHKDMLTCCRISHDGRLLCVGSDLFRELSIYDLSSGELVQQVKGMSTVVNCLDGVVVKMSAWSAGGCGSSRVQVIPVT